MNEDVELALASMEIESYSCQLEELFIPKLVEQVVLWSPVPPSPEVLLRALEEVERIDGPDWWNNFRHSIRPYKAGSASWDGDKYSTMLAAFHAGELVYWLNVYKGKNPGYKSRRDKSKVFYNAQERDVYDMDLPHVRFANTFSGQLPHKPYRK